MDDKTRIEKDIVMFEENIEKTQKMSLTNSQKKTITLAKDTKYYHKKKDYFTAFGCINYAHGLLDAIVKF